MTAPQVCVPEPAWILSCLTSLPCCWRTPFFLALGFGLWAVGSPLSLPSLLDLDHHDGTTAHTPPYPAGWLRLLLARPGTVPRITSSHFPILIPVPVPSSSSSSSSGCRPFDLLGLVTMQSSRTACQFSKRARHRDRDNLRAADTVAAVVSWIVYQPMDCGQHPKAPLSYSVLYPLCLAGLLQCGRSVWLHLHSTAAEAAAAAAAVVVPHPLQASPAGAP